MKPSIAKVLTLLTLITFLLATLPSVTKAATFNCSTVECLEDAITEANDDSIEDTINLTPGTYILTEPLPDILRPDTPVNPLNIVGPAIIRRSDTAPEFPIFVNSSYLTLRNLIVSGEVINVRGVNSTNLTFIGSTIDGEVRNEGNEGIGNLGIRDSAILGDIYNESNLGIVSSTIDGLIALAETGNIDALNATIVGGIDTTQVDPFFVRV